jgi:hypothetical protein
VNCVQGECASHPVSQHSVCMPVQVNLGSTGLAVHPSAICLVFHASMLSLWSCRLPRYSGNHLDMEAGRPVEAVPLQFLAPRDPNRLGWPYVLTCNAQIWADVSFDR